MQIERNVMNLHGTSICTIPTLLFLLFQTSNPTIENDVKMQEMEQLREWLPQTRELASSEEGSSRAERSSSDDDLLLSEHPGAKLSGKDSTHFSITVLVIICFYPLQFYFCVSLFVD